MARAREEPKKGLFAESKQMEGKKQVSKEAAERWDTARITPVGPTRIEALSSLRNKACSSGFAQGGAMGQRDG